MEHAYSRFLIFLLALWGPGVGMAQNIVTMTSGTLYIDGCQHPSGTIYDNGGPSNNYSHHFEGYVVISTFAGVDITLSGAYHTEQGYDNITVYDGYDATGNILAGPLSGSNTLSVTSTTGYLTLKFRSDGSVNSSGFALSYSCNATATACTNRPYGLTVDSIADTWVALSWSAADPTGQFRLTVGGTPTTVTGTHHTLTGLTSATAYDLTLSSLADTSNLCCSLRRKIRTSCNPLSRADLPYAYGFEDASGSGSSHTIDGCWTATETYPSSASSCSGSYAVYSSLQDNTDLSILSLPEYVDPPEETMLGFWARCATDCRFGEVEVGVMTDPFDTTTFVPVTTVTVSDSVYAYYAASLAAYSGSGHYVAMRMRGRVQALYIDDVTLQLIPDCPAITALQVEAVTATSMAVSWTPVEVGTLTPVGFEVTATPVGGGTAVTQITTDNPAILSGLTPTTDYTVAVRTLCFGNTYGLWDSVSARTSAAFPGDCQQPLVVVAEVDYRTVTLRWSADSNSSAWDIAYKKSGAAAWQTVATGYLLNQYTFSNLEYGTQYDFRVTVLCTGGSMSTTVSATTLCRQSTFHYDDLYAPFVTCYTGTFNTPRTTVGVVDNGSSSSVSRHTVHFDRSETDSRTGDMLHTVPEGYCTSVRLGNWETGAQAESITYTYTVDTTDYNLMLLKYAAVLQDPNHSPDHQPRFSFNITDTNGNDVSACYSADFVSNASLGWHTAGANVLWKDWTTVGVDLDPLQGQTIHITLTSYDCERSGHYGYAYFVLDLSNKGMLSNSCTSDENVFYAPSGFAYRWYSAADSATTLSTSDSLHVYTAGTFYCDLSFVGAPNDAAHANCYFTMAAVSGERHPWARFTTALVDTASCTYTWVRMQNHSIITRDTAHTDSIGDRCESYRWLFDDGTSSTEINPRHAFTPGSHSVTLYAMLAGGQCIDTATQHFFISTPCLRRDTVSRTMCEGDTLRMFDTLLTSSGCYQLDSITPEDTLWVRTLYLTLRKASRDTVALWKCHSYTWQQNGLTYDSSGCYCDTLTNAVGCDSIVTLALTLTDNYDTTLYDTICNGETFSFGGTELDTEGYYVDSLRLENTRYCDSITRLYLTVNPTIHIHLYDTLYDGDTVLFEGTACMQAGDYDYHDLNRMGCDSLRTLHLAVRRLVRDRRIDTICEGGSYLFGDWVLTEAGSYRDTLFANAYPTPDTLRTLTLVVVPLPQVSLSSSYTCGNEGHYDLTAFSSVPFLHWSAQPGDTALDRQADYPSVAVNPTDTTVYYATADYRSRPLCPVTDSLVVVPLQLVTAHIGARPTSLTADRRTVTAFDQSDGFVRQREWYVWYDEEASFFYGNDDSIGLTVPDYVDAMGLTLTVASDFCTDTDQLMIPIVSGGLFFPNVITPDEATNKQFCAYGSHVTEYELWIFDRQGDLMFHTTDINACWDGTHKGHECQRAAYAYKCRYKLATSDESLLQIGTVTILK